MTEAQGDADLALQDHVLVETEIGGRAVSFRAVIVKTSTNELWLGLTSPDRRLEGIDVGRQLQLTVARPGYALVGQSAFVRHLGESRSRIFAVIQTPKVERVQRRAHARIDVEMELRLRKLDPATGLVRGRGACGTTINASSGGLLFLTDMQLAVGEQVEIALSISGNDRISAAGRVSRVREPEAARAANCDEPVKYLVGIKFIRITAVDQQRIVRHCVFLEHRRQMAARQAGGTMNPHAVAAPQPAAPQPAAAPPAGIVPASSTQVRASAPGPAARPVAALAAPSAAAVAAAVAMALGAQAAQINSIIARTPVPGAGPSRPPGPPNPEPATHSQQPGTSPAPGPAAPVARAILTAVQARLAEMRPDAPLIEVGLALCDVAGDQEIRSWFDGLMPFDRIGLLSQIQANMHGEAVPGAAESGQVRPLAHALGLL